MIVWDTGTLRNLTERDGEPVDLADAIAADHLDVELTGHKLAGAFALTRTAMNGDPRNSILVMVDDAGADRRRSPATTELH